MRRYAIGLIIVVLGLGPAQGQVVPFGTLAPLLPETTSPMPQVISSGMAALQMNGFATATPGAAVAVPESVQVYAIGAPHNVSPLLKAQLATTSQLATAKSELSARLEKLEQDLTASKNVLADIRLELLKRFDALPMELAKDETSYDLLKERLVKDLGGLFEAKLPN